METPYQFYNNQLGVRVSFITADKNPRKESLKLIKYRTLRYRLKSANHSIKQLCRGCLNTDALVLFSSLCREWKDSITTKFGDPQQEVKRSWFAKQYITDGNARDFFIDHRYGEKNEKKLDLKLIEQYTYNASVLNTALKMKENRKDYAKALGGVKIDIWDSLSKDINAFKEVPHKLPKSRDGIRKKVSDYAKALNQSPEKAYLSLISKKLQNSNAKKVADKSQEALIDELLGKHTNLDHELIAELYNVVAGKMDWKPIDAMTVANRSKKSNLITHAGRNGIKSLKNNVLMQNKRKRPSSPMLYWTLDGWDVELMYQKTSVNDKGQKVTSYHNRFSVVLVLDPHNNYPVGYAIGTHETPGLIKEALKNAMTHVRDLFGELYKPYQLQSDNYAKKKLTPVYERVSPHYTPAEVGNAKSKVIENYFGTQLNKKYCKLHDNWSGHNVDSGSKSQPNSEYQNKIKKSFPDAEGCLKQIHSIIHQLRQKKQKEYTQNWDNTNIKYRSTMSPENFLLTFGKTSGDTNKLRGEGIRLIVDGQEHNFDSFDINFRHQAHRDWQVYYDQNDMDQALAVSKDGSERFMLEKKYIQPMALADRTENDPKELKKVRDFNKTAEDTIIDQRAENAEILEGFFDQPELKDTMAKTLLTDSLGQHKNHKSEERLQASKEAEKIERKAGQKAEKKKEKTFADEQDEFYAGKVDVNEYLND